MSRGKNRDETDRSGDSGRMSLWAFSVRVLIGGTILAFLFFFFLLIWYIFDFILIAFGGVLITLIIRSMSNPLRRALKLPDSLTVVLVILAIAGILSLVFWALSGQIADQVNELGRKLPDSLEQIQNKLQHNLLGRKILEEIPRVQDWLKKGEILTGVKRVFSVTFGVVIDVVLLIFIGLYFSFNPGIYIRGLLRLVPSHRRQRAAEVTDTVGNMLRRWLIGRLVGMAVIGILTGSGLWLLGVPLALILGILAFLLDFIPFIGPVVSAIPAVLLAFVESPIKALYVIGLYVLIQNTENYILIPVIEKHQVYLPPVAVIFGQIILGLIAGILGLAIATPLITVALVIVNMLYIEDILGEKGGVFGEK